jgi:hypothetical protein
MKKLIVALAAVAAVGMAALPSDASAQGRGHGGWHGGGGYHGGGWRGGWRGPGFGFYGAPYAYGSGYYGGCYRTVRVSTPYGLRWRRVWVCG